MNYSFLNDYNQLCHKEVFDYVAKYLDQKTLGYEEDVFCEQAKAIIKDKFNCPQAMVQFFIGGTSANLTMISHMLNHSYQAIIATKHSHIANHEGGAIEGSGHKILIADDIDGKILPESIEKIYIEHEQDIHMVIPKMVYISNVTEVGTIYSLEELQKIHALCQKYNLYLYIDGARLFTAIYSEDNDIMMSDYAKYSDVFYIGGTKNGLMLGEAVVIVNKQLQCQFMRQMKNKGAMLAKGSLIGLNFLALFQNDLYQRIAIHANQMATKIADYLTANNYQFIYQPAANMIFVNMTEEQATKLASSFAYIEMSSLDPKVKAIRLVTSFTTTEADLEQLFKLL